MEVIEEEELKRMKQERVKFENIKNAELSEIQRLEATETRLKEETVKIK